MPEYDYSLVEAAVIEAQGNTLRLLRDVLSRMGIKRIETHATFKEADALLSVSTPDVLLVDVDDEQGEAFKFIRTLRNEPGSPNPFAVVIATTWHPTATLLMRVTNCGADGLLVKPVSPKQVQERVVSFIEGRKAFVVTADYVGPDRRKSPREGNQVPLLDVPNTLRLKATGLWGTAKPRKLIGDGLALVNEQKRQRCAVQASFLIEFAAPGLVTRQPDRMSIDHVARVRPVVEDLQRRLPDGGEMAHADTLSNALKTLAERLRAHAEDGPVPGEELAKARQVAEELMQAADPSRPAESFRREVQTAVAAYRVRLEQLAQAKAEQASQSQTQPQSAAG